jgi:hypothetical protein
MENNKQRNNNKEKNKLKSIRNKKTIKREIKRFKIKKIKLKIKL